MKELARLILAVLIGVAAATAVDVYAQRARLNDQTGDAPTGLRRDSGVWSFRFPGSDQFAPTVLGILTPPQTEPTDRSQSGAFWLFCAGTTERTCTMKVNDSGNILEFGSVTYRFQ